MTSSQGQPSVRVQSRPLTAAAFQPYGEVVSRPLTERRRYLSLAFDRSEAAGSASLWISRATNLQALPLQLVVMERHPHSAQTFIPLERGRYLVAVCDALVDGAPDPATCKVFIAGPDQAVTIARNVWHHPMTVLDGPLEFAVAMTLKGGGDDVFVDLARGIDVLAPADQGLES